MRKTATIFFSILILLCIISCSSEGVVDDAFTASVTFNGNGATSGSMTSQKAGRGSDIRLAANAYERPCYSFTGWNTASDGSGTAYTDRQSINTKENITLYAQWELDAVILTSSSFLLFDDNYTLNSDVTISSTITVSGNVTLLLADGYTLTASGGIRVNEGNTLTIEAGESGTGRLIATGEGTQAGIGSMEGAICGTVIINGGVITATGGSEAAGIGGGKNGSDGTLTLGTGVSLQVSDNNSDWTDYDGSLRKKYMKTVQ